MEDLGVGSKDAGARRNCRTIKARTAKAKGRASAVRTLRKVDARAKNLIATNIAPVQFYGAEVQGLNTAEIARMRSTVAKAAAGRGIAPCPTAIIAIEVGTDKDPAVNRPAAQIELWQGL